jgi:glycosyltransferase involved in cell wall biosynthesis
METPVQVWILDLAAMVPYYTGHLCEWLEKDERAEVRLASVRYRHDLSFFERQGIRNRLALLDCAYEGPGRRVVKAIEYLLNLGSVLARAVVRRPDVLHVQFLPLLTLGLQMELWALRVIHMLGCDIVYTVHNVLPQDSGNRLRKRYAEAYRLADRLICHDPGALHRLIHEFGIPADLIATIPHGPLFASEPRSSASGARLRLGFKEQDRVVLWQGIIRPYKGLSFLLDVWRRVCKEEPDALLVVAGTGEAGLLASFRIAAADLPRVRLDLRFLSVAEVIDYYDAADLIVYPYSEITTSGALMTGISAGKAIVASDLPAFAGCLRNGQTGCLLPYGDLNAWSQTLRKLIRDDERRNSLARNLRNANGSIPSWSGIANSTIDVYLETSRQRSRAKAVASW